jgi:hypothetical protein
MTSFVMVSHSCSVPNTFSSSETPTWTSRCAARSVSSTRTRIESIRDWMVSVMPASTGVSTALEMSSVFGGRSLRLPPRSSSRSISTEPLSRLKLTAPLPYVPVSSGLTAASRSAVMETEMSAFAPSDNPERAWMIGASLRASAPPLPVRPARSSSTTSSEASTFSVSFAIAGLVRLRVAPARV